MNDPVHVAVGIISNEKDEVLIAFRHHDKHQGGLWEFPGGKLEAGENVGEALHRELKEELDLDTLEISPLLKIEHDYGDKTVLLDVWNVDSYAGQARGLEGQQIKWVGVKYLQNYEFPKANLEIVTFLSEADRI
mgnify:CR=1 FL=1|tara:strand:- start:514 stop:915 length:402 start_codon:yes stop_codon:yes gene_type:complete